MGGKGSKTSPAVSVERYDTKERIKGRKKEDDPRLQNSKHGLQKEGHPSRKPLPPRPRLKKKSTNLDALFIEGESLPKHHRPLSPIPHRRQDVMNNLLGLDSCTSSTRSLSSQASWHTDTNSLNQIQYQNYEYPFENVVFEGGGVKGLAYAGAIRVLEDIGVWQNVKRFAGTSAGSMWAALAALGYNSYEVEDFLRQDLRTQFLDASCGYCSILPNLRKYFGWHPGRKIFSWFGKVIEERTAGDANITFKELYDCYGKELCVVVTNVNMMDAEYCHVKTTPSLPIRTAVRMSMAIPGLFGAVKYSRFGRTDVYVDGGVLCNYPVHCFDGWWLSMERGDSFLCKMKPLHDLPHLWEKEERFGVINEKTIGMLLYASDDQDLMVNKMKQLNNLEPPKRPKTKLSLERKEKKDLKERAAAEHELVVEAFEMFFKVLDESQIDQDMSINREELEKAFTKSEFTDHHAKLLFGDEYTVSEVFDYLDLNQDGEINFNELIAFAEQKGVRIQNLFQGYDRREINSVADFLVAVQDTMLINVKRVFMTEDDINRTIGIDTLYIGTTDWDMEDEDKAFLIEQGGRATRSFLRHYVRNNDPPLKGVKRVDSDALTKPL